MRITKDPETRREDILEAAQGLFKEEGFDKVSVESITKEAGISKGSFYNYFKTKESVYEAVIADIASKNLTETKKLLSDKKISPKERLVKYIDWTFRLDSQQEKSLSRVLSLNENSRQRQMYMQAFDEGTNQMLPIFESLIAEGMTVGEFNILNARFTAVIMLGAFRGIHVTFYNGLKIDLNTGRLYLNDFLSRLLGTNI